MDMTIVISILISIIGVATPILIAAQGELVVEKAGVLNLGVEGMMLVGAVSGFACATLTGSAAMGALFAIFAGAMASSLFAVLTLWFMTNQVATGLALTIFGIGFSALIGEPFVGRTVVPLSSPFPAALAEHEVLRLVFGHSPMVYIALLLTFGVSYFLNRTRAGLILRAVGESAEAAHAIGYDVLRVRFLAVLFGGGMAGLAGSFYSLVLTPMWAEKLTAGRGWIALALVVFASWLPWRLMGGALLFGAVMTFELQAKAMGMNWIQPEFLAMTPYLATILVLVIIALRPGAARHNAPAALGQPFRPAA